MLRLMSTMTAQGVATLGGMALSIVIARALGPEGLGSFTILFSAVSLSSLVAKRGVDILVTRATAQATLAHDESEFPALLARAFVMVLQGCAVVGVIAWVLLSLGLFGAPLPYAGIALAVTLPAFASLAVVATHLKGLRLTWLAPLFEAGSLSAMTAGAFLALSHANGAADLALVAPSLMVGSAVLVGLAVLVLTIVWRRRSVRLSGFRQSEFARASLSRGQVELTTIAAVTFLVQAGSFLLAAPFLAEDQLGLLRAAERLAQVVSFPSLAIMPLIMASIVTHARTGDRVQQRRLLVRAGLGGGALAILPFLFMLVFPELALSLMGPEFGGAATYLRVLAAVNLVAVTLNPLTIFLNLAGHERSLMWISLATLGASVLLYSGLSWAYGGIGFVTAYAAVVCGRLLLVFRASTARL